ncbi:MAG TPA: hypothetical protein VGD24_08580 [Gallionella sp.]
MLPVGLLPLLCALLSAVMLSVALLPDAIAGTPAQAGAKCLFPDSMVRAPAWICGARIRGWRATAVGTAAKSDAGDAFMEQMAAADARTRLARKLSRQDSGGDRSSTITDETLRSSRIIKRAYGPDGRLYVLVGIDEIGAKQPVESATAKSPRPRRD